MTKELRYKMQLMMIILLQRKCLMIKLRVSNFFTVIAFHIRIVK